MISIFQQEQEGCEPLNHDMSPVCLYFKQILKVCEYISLPPGWT